MIGYILRILPGFVRRRLEGRVGLLKILDNISWLFFDRFLRMGVGLLVGVWIARYLGPAQFGLLSFAWALVGLFGAMATMGLQGIMVREMVLHGGKRNEIMGTGFVLQLLGGFASFLMLVVLIYFLRPDDKLAQAVVCVLAFTQLFKATEVVRYWFEAEVRSKYVVWVENVVFLLVGGVNITLILMRAPFFAFVVSAAAQVVLVSVLLLGLYVHKVGGLFLWRPAKARAKQLLADSWPLILSGIAVTVYMKIDQVMLGYMLDDAAVGVYAAAVQISTVWYFVPMAIAGSVFPAILHAKKQSEALYYKRLQGLFNLMVGLALGVAIPMTFLAPWIVALLYGTAYDAADTVLSIHIWAAVFVFLGVASGKWFIAENRQVLSMQRTFLGAVSNIVLNLFLIPLYGINGAAVATIISYACAGMFYDIVQKETRPLFVMKIKAFLIHKWL